MKRFTHSCDQGGEVVLTRRKDGVVTLTMPEAEARELYDVLHEADQGFGTYMALADMIGRDLYERL